MAPRTALKKAESVKERKGKRAATEEVLVSDEEPKAKAPKIERNGTDKLSKSKTVDPPSPSQTGDSGVGAEATGGSDESNNTTMDKSKVKETRKRVAVSRSASARVAKTTSTSLVEEPEEKKVAPKKGKVTKSASVKLPPKVPKDVETKEPKATSSKTAKALASIREKVAKKPPPILEEESEDECTENMTALDINVTQDTNNNSNISKVSRSRMATAPKRARLTVLPVQDRGTGQAFTFGSGQMGQLGLGEGVTKRNYPSLIEEFEGGKVLQIVAGGLHTVVLTDDGSVWTFGVNDDKALGRVTEEEEDGFTPGKVNLSTKIVQVTAGDSHSAALSENGDVWAWGTFKDMNGSFGLVPGDGEICRIEPQLITRNLSVKIKKIASGDHHLAMLAEDGKIYTCGTGEQGQLGRLKSKTEGRMTRSKASTSILQVSEKDVLLTPAEVKIPRKKFSDIWTGGFSTYCQTERNNEIWVFGLNNYYQLGMRGVSDEDTVIEQPVKSSGFKGIKWSQIAAGQHHAVCLDQNGKVYTLGRTNDGRLGLGDLLSNSATDAEQFKGFEKQTDGSIAVSVPTAIPSLNNVKCVQVSAGLSTAYAVTSDGKLYAWGFGENFQLGTGTQDDLLTPSELEYMVVKAKKMEIEGRIIYVSGGGQHVGLILNRQTSQSRSSPVEKK